MKAVVTLAVGPNGRDLLAATGPAQRAYADRVGARFVVIGDDAISPDYPLAAKFQLSRIQPHFDRILFLDGDVLLRPDCPDLFAEVPSGSVGIYDDYPDLQTHDWLQTEYRALAASQDQPDPTPHPVCRNTGVVVFDKEHTALWQPPARPYPAVHCAEQHIVNLNLLRAGYPVFNLPRRFNTQWWSNRESFATSDAPVLHFAGMSNRQAGGVDHAYRLDQVRRRAGGMGFAAAAPTLTVNKDCGCGGASANFRQAQRDAREARLRLDEAMRTI